MIRTIEIHTTLELCKKKMWYIFSVIFLSNKKLPGQYSNNLPHFAMFGVNSDMHIIRMICLKYMFVFIWFHFVGFFFGWYLTLYLFFWFWHLCYLRWTWSDKCKESMNQHFSAKFDFFQRGFHLFSLLFFAKRNFSKYLKYFLTAWGK